MKHARMLPLCCALAAAVSCGGCSLLLVGAGAAAGAGTVAYLQGELKANLDAPLAKVLKAADATMKEMKLKVLERTEGVERGKIIANAPGDKRLEVRLEKLTPNATEVRIRVGVFGDEDLSREILEKIQKRL